MRVVPTATNQWEPFLNVWDAYGSGTPSSVTLVEDAANKAHGALITKGPISVLALFNGLPGPDLPGPHPVAGGYWDWAKKEPTTATILATVRLRSSDYAVTFDAGSHGTKALLFDLDPSASWTYTVNGGRPLPLTVGADGVAVAEIAATGRVTLAVSTARRPIQ